MGKKEEFKVGDYIYYKDEDGCYNFGKIHKIESGQMWCYWSYWNDKHKEIPKTIKAFNSIKKQNVAGWMNINNDYNSCEIQKIIFNSSSSKNEKIIKHIINGNKTIVVINNSDGTYDKGIARCNPEDEFDEYFGFSLAYARAFYMEDDVTRIKIPNLSDCSDEDIVAELGRRLNEKEGK